MEDMHICDFVILLNAQPNSTCVTFIFQKSQR